MNKQNNHLSEQLLVYRLHKTNGVLFRMMVVYVGLAILSVFSLFSQDINIITDLPSLDVPFAGQVSFIGFMITVPVTFIVMRIILGVHVEKLQRDKARLVLAADHECINSLANKTMIVFMLLALEILFPVVLLLLAWKAAVFPALGTGLILATFMGVSFQLYKICKWSPLKHGVITAIVFSVLGVAYGQQNSFNLKRGLDLDRLYLVNKILDYTDLSRATIKRGGIVTSNLKYVDLSAATFIETVIDSSSLFEAKLIGSTIVDTKFVKSNLIGIDFRGSAIKSSDFSKSDLTKVNLSGSDISDTKFIGAKLVEANFRGSVIESTDLSETNLTKASLSGSNISDTFFLGANLEYVDFSEANFKV